MDESRSTRKITYEVRDRSGRLVAEHVREDDPDGSKKVWWKRPDGQPGLNGTRLEDLPLYLSEEVADYEEQQVVVLAEGEKAAAALRAAGIPVVGTVTGASQTPSEKALEALRGRRVCLWPDNDEPGRAHMNRIGSRLQNIADEVLVFEWPDAPDKGDAADHPDLAALEVALETAPRWEPPPSENGHGPATATAGFNQTDLGNSERLVAQHGEDLRYVHAWGSYLLYTGQRWEHDRCDAVKAKATETVRSIYHETGDTLDSTERKTLAAHAKQSEAKSRIEAMLSLAEHMVAVKPEDLDSDPWQLNVENGTVDLRTGELHPHRRTNLITKLAPVEYEYDAKAPVFEAFLEEVLPSEALRKFVQKVLGYALTGDVSEQALFFFYGAGANGKSTLINMVLELLGDYAMQAAPELLTVKGNTHPTELADLMGARFVASVEVDEGKRLAESLVKQMTGGDRIKARKMRQDFFEFSPTHKVALAANHKPTIKGTDHAMWRRIKLVPFDVTIPKEDQDPKLAEKLRAELPGILAWAVRGCLEWQREGLGEPDEVRDATAEYKAEMDVLAAFIDECCIVNEKASATASDLFFAYTSWCEENRETAEKKRSFGSRLRERGYQPGRDASGSKRIWKGIGLRHDGPGPPGEDRDPSRNDQEIQDEAGFSDTSDVLTHPDTDLDITVHEKELARSYRKHGQNTSEDLNTSETGPAEESAEEPDDAYDRLVEERIASFADEERF